MALQWIAWEIVTKRDMGIGRGGGCGWVAGKPDWAGRTASCKIDQLRFLAESRGRVTALYFIMCDDYIGPVVVCFVYDACFITLLRFCCQ